MAGTMLYLDNNATTAVDPRVLEALLPWLQGGYGNPSSVYSLGRAAREAVDTAREHLAALLDGQPGEIIFTSGGTESINTALLSAAQLDPDRRKVITSAVEHSATLKLCDHLARRGYEIVRLGVDAEGLLDLDELEAAMDDETALVSLLWANNETGVLFPVEEIGARCVRRKVPLHLDAVQAVGKLPVSVGLPGLSFLSVSGHKLYAPKGVGALWVSRRMKYHPLLRGSQEGTRRGGTENVASIVALGRAAELARTEFLDAEEKTIRGLRDHFEEQILELLPGTRVNGHRTRRLPNTSNLSFSGIDAESALLLLDQAEVCCSAGSACTSGSVSPSHVLQAMGLSTDDARASLRFSFGCHNQSEDAERAVGEVVRVVEKLRRENPRTGSPVLVASAAP